MGKYKRVAAVIYVPKRLWHYNNINIYYVNYLFLVMVDKCFAEFFNVTKFWFF